MRRCKIVAEVVLLALVLGGLPAFLVWRLTRPDPERLPPEAQKIKELCDKIEIDMPEAEVDKLLAGYESGEFPVSDPNSDNRGNQFPRPAARRKYYTKTGGNEGDYLICVYFDYFGRVVGKFVSMWQK
jgi:hypothetical protein